MMEKKRLLLVADTYYPKVDGTLRFMEEFVKRAQNEFEITLLVPKFPDLGTERRSHLVENIVFIDHSKKLKVSGYPNMAFSLKNLRKIKNAVKEADIVFVQGPAFISYLSIYYGRKYHKKTVFYVHTIAWELFAKFFPPFLNKIFGGLIKVVSLFFYNRCTALLVPYHGLKTNLTGNVRVPIHVAQLGVDVNLFSPPGDKRLSKQNIGIDPDKVIIGYVGRVSKEKNVKVLLEAFLRLPQQDKLFLLIVGDGPREQVKKFNEVPHCRVTGFVDNVQDYTKAMDIFVMPSLTETTSLATLEAMSTGIPVIVSRVGYIKEYVVRNHNGIFFPRNNEEILAVKMESLLRDKTFQRYLGENARKTAVYSFSWEQSIQRITRLLKEA